MDTAAGHVAERRGGEIPCLPADGDDGGARAAAEAEPLHAAAQAAAGGLVELVEAQPQQLMVLC